MAIGDTTLYTRYHPGGRFSVVDKAEMGEGQVWWVGSAHTYASDSTGCGHDPKAPFATLVYAVARAVASPSGGVDDTIYVMQGHSETWTAAGAAVLTLSPAGLKVKGIGGRTRKPTFLIDTNAGNYISITGADTVLQNVIIKAGHADIAKAVNIAAAGVEIRNVDFLENTATENFLISILSTNAADDLLVDGCRIIQPDASNTEGIELVGAVDRVTITNNYIRGPFSVSCISITTAACSDLYVDNNRLMNTLAGDDLAGCLDVVAASTGMVTNNRVYMEDNTDCLTSIDAANCGRGGNVCANEYGEEAGAAAAVSA